MSRNNRKVNSNLIEESYKLGLTGINNLEIIKALNISKSCLYANVDLMDSIKKARKDILTKRTNEALELELVAEPTPRAIEDIRKRIKVFTDIYYSI